MERRRKKSKNMKMVEDQYGEQLHTLLPRLYNLYRGLQGMVEHMNMNKSTIHNWMLHEGVVIESRAYEPGEKTIDKKEFEYNERVRDLEDENKRLKQELEFSKGSSELAD
jgi:hypothetical protein